MSRSRRSLVRSLCREPHLACSRDIDRSLLSCLPSPASSHCVGESYDERVDNYSYGTILYSLYTRHTYFHDVRCSPLLSLASTRYTYLQVGGGITRLGCVRRAAKDSGGRGRCGRVSQRLQEPRRRLLGSSFLWLADSLSFRSIRILTLVPPSNRSILLSSPSGKVHPPLLTPSTLSLRPHILDVASYDVSAPLPLSSIEGIIDLTASEMLEPLPLPCMPSFASAFSFNHRLTHSSPQERLVDSSPPSSRSGKTDDPD